MSQFDVIKKLDYDTFGSIIIDSDETFAIPFGFAGGLFDKDTGLVRFGFRDYDPDIGRWTAKDPIFFAGGDVNLYGYCLNNPVDWADPWGLFLAVADSKDYAKVKDDLEKLTGYEINIACCGENSGRVSMTEKEIGEGYMNRNELEEFKKILNDPQERTIYVCYPGSDSYEYLINTPGLGGGQTYNYEIHYISEGGTVPSYRILGHEIYIHTGYGHDDRSTWGR